MRAWCGAVYIGVGAVQVSDDTFGVEHLRVRAEVGAQYEAAQPG